MLNIIWFLWNNRNNWLCPVCEVKLTENFNYFLCDNCNVSLYVPPPEEFNFQYYLNNQKIKLNKLRKMRKIKAFL